MATKALSLQPLGDRLVIKPLAQEEATASGIILPGTAREKPTRGEVVAVGNGRTLDDGTRVKLEIQTGDTVLYGKYTGTEVKLEGETYVILQERDVLGVFAK